MVLRDFTVVNDRLQAWTVERQDSKGRNGNSLRCICELWVAARHRVCSIDMDQVCVHSLLRRHLVPPAVLNEVLLSFAVIITTITPMIIMMPITISITTIIMGIWTRQQSSQSDEPGFCGLDAHPKELPRRQLAFGLSLFFASSLCSSSPSFNLGILSICKGRQTTAWLPASCCPARLQTCRPLWSKAV